MALWYTTQIICVTYYLCDEQSGKHRGNTMAFTDDELAYLNSQRLTRLATAENEGELLDIAERTAPSQLGTAVAAWSARNEDEASRNRRHLRDRWRMRSQVPQALRAASAMTAS